MGKLKQLHIDCTPDKCVAPAEWQHTCYVRGSEQDIDPSEPPEDTEGSDRDPSIDVDRD